ncbi:hypothetical protein EZZ79_08865 [Pseudomonas syringae]|nr:hypothetical protein EZZ79_08865 [Pseudomonas syringae]
MERHELHYHAERSSLYLSAEEPGGRRFQAPARRAWEQTGRRFACSRRRRFRRCIFGDCTGAFANKFAPTAFGQNQKQMCV